MMQPEYSLLSPAESRLETHFLCETRSRALTSAELRERLRIFGLFVCGRLLVVVLALHQRAFHVAHHAEMISSQVLCMLRVVGGR